MSYSVGCNNILLGLMKKLTFLNIGLAFCLLTCNTQIWAQDITADAVEKMYQRALDTKETDSDSSLVYINQIMDWAKENDNPEWLIKSNTLIAEVYFFRNEREQGFDYLIEALEVSSDNGLVEGEIDINYTIGLHYSRSARRGGKVVDEGKLHTALAYHRKGIELSEKHELPIAASKGYNLTGVCFMRLGDAEQALEAYEISENYSRAANDSLGLGYTLDYAGALLAQVGQTDQAKEKLLEALDIKKALGDIFGYAIILNNVGEFYWSQNDYTNAIAYLGSSFELSSTNLYQDLAIHTASVMASIYEDREQFERAYQLKKEEMLLMDTLYSINRAKSLMEIETKYETVQKDKSILEQQQTIQQKELALQERTLSLVLVITVILIISGILFYLFKQKQAAAQKAVLELELAEQKEQTRIQKERLRISRELHDNIGPYLTLMSASVEQVKNNTADNDCITRLHNSITLSMRELRKSVWLLNRQTITVDEIAIRIRDFFKPLREDGAKSITVTTNGDTEVTLTEIQTTHLFRIIQEAINNAYKHAESSSISVEIATKSEEKLRFSIVDNGIGFDPDTIQPSNGLQNMESRIAELGGELKVKSTKGKGTSVEGCFDLNFKPVSS